MESKDMLGSMNPIPVLKRIVRCLDVDKLTKIIKIITKDVQYLRKFMLIWSYIKLKKINPTFGKTQG